MTKLPIAMWLVLLAAACRRDRPAESREPSAPATMADFTWSLENVHEATRLSREWFIVDRKTLDWLAERPLLASHGLVIWDAMMLENWLRQDRDLRTVAVAGRRVGREDDLKTALRDAARRGSLALTVRTADDEELTLHIRAREPIGDAELDAAIRTRSDGVVQIARDLARRLRSDPAQVTQAALFRGVDDGPPGFACSGVTLSFSSSATNRFLPRLGFREGDILLDVNGFRVCGAELPPPSLLDAPSFTWHLKRDGRPHSLTWLVQ